MIAKNVLGNLGVTKRVFRIFNLLPEEVFKADG